MKNILILIITLIALYAFSAKIPYKSLLLYYGVLAAIPIVIIYLKRHLVNGLLIWFFFVLLSNGLYRFGAGAIRLPMLPDPHMDRIIWLAVYSIFLIEILSRQRRMTAGITFIELTMGVLCIYIIFSMILSGTFADKSRGLTLNTLLSGYVIPFSIFFLSQNLIDNEERTKKVFLFFVMIGTYLSVTGIAEFFKWDSLVFPPYISHPWVGIHYGRARGPFLQATVEGTVLGMIFFMTFYIFTLTNKAWKKVCLSLLMILILTTVLFTMQRASWLGVIIPLFLIPIFFKQARTVIIMGYLALAILGFTQYSYDNLKLRYYYKSDEVKEESIVKKIAGRTTEASSVYGREYLYITAWKMFIDRPLMGVGYNSYREHSGQYLQPIKGIPYKGNVSSDNQLHDSWISILVELGLVGMSFVLFILFSFFTISIKLYSILPREGFYSKKLIVIFWAISVVYFINSMLIQMNYFLFPNSTFYLMCGILVGLYKRMKTGDSTYKDQTHLSSFPI